jgi:hypothetical protein
MKNNRLLNLLSLAAMMLWGIQSAFAFIAPTTTPAALPGPGTSAACRPLHIGSDSYTGMNFYGTASNLYAHSWSTAGMSSPCVAGGAVTGIAYRRYNTANTVVLQSGYLPLAPDLMDMEVTIVVDGAGTYYIVASYYKNGAGHYYQVFKWTTAGIGAIGAPVLLNAQSGYSRISIDGFRCRYFTITWDDLGTGIRALAGVTSGGGVTFGTAATIVGSSQQAFPDVEVYNASGTPRVSFVYFLNNNAAGQGNITVSDIPWATVMAGGGIAPAVIDVNPSAFAYWTPGTFTMYTAAGPGSLNLDRPDDHTIGNWSYIYTDDFQRIKARMRSTGLLTTFVLNNGSIAPLIDLTTSMGNPMINYWPTIAFDNDGENIHYGWYSYYPGAEYVALKMHVNGTLLVSDYMTVSNVPNLSGTQAMQFSKQNEDARLFATYTMYSSATDYYLNNKYVPWGASAFKTTGVENVSDAQDVLFFPNPYTNELNIQLPAEMNAQFLTISVTDITGRKMDVYGGMGNLINSHLNQVSRTWVPGMYLITVENTATGFMHTYKVQKAN